jgi:hypothetical protein
MDRLAPSQRHTFTFDNRKIYEWDQTLSEVNIYIDVPPGVRAKELFVEIKQSHIRIGIKPNPPYLDVSLLCPYWHFSTEALAQASGPVLSAENLPAQHA